MVLPKVERLPDGTLPGAKEAMKQVAKAIKRGLLPKITENTKCIDCGARATVYDHRDYGMPLAVEPVCQSCNIQRGPALSRQDPLPAKIAAPLDTDPKLIQWKQYVDNLDYDVETVISYFGSVKEVCRRLKVTRGAVSQWRVAGKLPKGRVYQICIETKGRLTPKNAKPMRFRKGRLKVGNGGVK